MKSTDSGNFSFTEDTLVSIAPAQHIHMEWRWFVVGGKIIDGSIYRLRGQRLIIHERDPRVIAEAQTFADKWLPDHYKSSKEYLYYLDEVLSDLQTYAGGVR